MMLGRGTEFLGVEQVLALYRKGEKNQSIIENITV
jgi:hypothetical protein